MALPPAALPSGMQPPPTPVSSTSAVHRPPGTGPGPGPGHGHGPPSAHGHHPHSHPLPHQHTHGHGPQTPVTPSLAVAGLQYGPDPTGGLPSYQQQHPHSQQVHHGHGHGMAPQPQPQSQHSGYSSPWGDPPHAHALVGPPAPARPASSASASAGAGVGGMSMGLNGAPGGTSQQQQRYGGELREDSWGGGGGGEGDLEVRLFQFWLWLWLLCVFVLEACRFLFRPSTDMEGMLFSRTRTRSARGRSSTCLIASLPRAELPSYRATELPSCSLRCVLHDI